MHFKPLNQTTMTELRIVKAKWIWHGKDKNSGLEGKNGVMANIIGFRADVWKDRLELDVPAVKQDTGQP